MSNSSSNVDTNQDRWARFRFSIIGPLLASPPNNGELQTELMALSKKQWRHPLTGRFMTIGLSTIERWFYQAKEEKNPVNALKTKQRCDAGLTSVISTEIKQIIRQQYKAHPSWSYQLHYDNLCVELKKLPKIDRIPAYHTVRRYMKKNAMSKQHRIRNRNTVGALLAQERLETREVRSFEVDHVHTLWHLDFHHGSCRILGRDGQWHKPLLLAILDDRSRLICHAQWYFDETAETLVHGFTQALQKRGVPRALMSDNGSAMTSGEFTQGLERLSILHQPTLPYSPYQNAKQEVFWAQVEGRLMAMLEGVDEISLQLLNEATLAWIEFEYHRKIHSEIGCTPLERYLNDPNVGRECPNQQTLRDAFCIAVSRKQRRSDGTISLEGKRFEIPSSYRHQEYLTIHYARWDLSYILLVDPKTKQPLCALHPQDKSANAGGLRRTIQSQAERHENSPLASGGIAPLLKELIAEYAATGLPPAYQPKGE